MAKRFTDTDKWNDDWYVSLNNDYRIIWQWLLDNCDHAGICKPSIGMINMLCKTNISEDDLLKKMDGRILKCDGFWFIPKFLKFQYKTLNVNKPAILSVIKLLKDKGLLKITNELFGNDFLIIEQSLNNDHTMIKESLDNHSVMIKDKDKDKDKDIRKGGVGENHEAEFSFWSNMPLPKDVGDLPELKVKSAIELVKITKGIDVTWEDVVRLWGVFKINNLTGKKYYASEVEVEKHFTNWIKNQKFENNGKATKPTNGKQAGAKVLLSETERNWKHLEDEKKGQNTALPSSFDPLLEDDEFGV